MKKLLLILLLIPTITFGQTNVKKHSLHYTGNGVPVGYTKFTGISTNCTYKDLTTSITYLYKGNSVWVEDNTVYPVLKGDKGDQGIQGVQGERGQQGVTGVQGMQGIQGTQGIQGAKGDPGVCPSCPPSGGGMAFPWIVVSGTGNVTTDTQVMQSAMNQNAIDNRPIYTVGNCSFGNLSIAKFQLRFSWIGYGSKIQMSGTIKRVGANDVSEATAMTDARHHIEGMELWGNTNIDCFDLGPSQGADFRNIKIKDFKTGIKLRFGLKTLIENCEFLHCIYGIGVDIDNCPGASYVQSNAQSNGVHVISCRFVATNATQSAIYVYGCSGFVGNGNQFEGVHFVKMIDKDWKGSPNDKDFYMGNSHIEPVAGNTGTNGGESYFYLRGVGIYTIEGVYSQYGGCFIDAGGTSGGAELTVEVIKTGWVVTPSSGKLFNHAGMVHWLFRANSYQTPLNKPYQLDGAFAGVQVKQFKGVEDPVISGKIIEAPTTGNQTPNTYLIQ